MKSASSNNDYFASAASFTTAAFSTSLAYAYIKQAKSRLERFYHSRGRAEYWASLQWAQFSRMCQAPVFGQSTRHMNDSLLREMVMLLQYTFKWNFSFSIFISKEMIVIEIRPWFSQLRRNMPKSYWYNGWAYFRACASAYQSWMDRRYARYYYHKQLYFMPLSKWCKAI